MFVKRSVSKGKNRDYVSYIITRSYYENGKNKHESIANISKLPMYMIDLIKKGLKDPESVLVSDLEKTFLNSKLYGPIAFLLIMMQKTGMMKALNNIDLKYRKLIIAEILCRILAPQSKLSSIEWIRNTAIPEILNIDVDSLNENKVYYAMDKLEEKSEEVVGDFTCENREKATFFLYDISSVYFHGKGPEIACNGYSRDKRPDLNQVLVALCLNQDGMPIFFDLLPGNIQDKKTVIPIIQLIKERYGIGKFTFVGDRGMITAENVEWLIEEELDYILGLTHTEAIKVINRQKNIRQLFLFDKKKSITIETDEEKGIKHVLCSSEYRREHDLYCLNRIIEKGRKALEDVQGMIKKGSIKKHDKVIRRAQKKLTKAGADNFFDFEYSNGKLTIIENKEYIEAHKNLCGFFILKTTEMDMPPEEVEARYKRLNIVEDAFKDLKNLVNIRPVYHYKYFRVHSHFLICILAQTLARKCKYNLIEKGWITPSNKRFYHTFINDLSEITLGTFKIENKNIKIINEPGKKHLELLKLFGISKSKFKDYKNIIVQK